MEKSKSKARFFLALKLLTIVTTMAIAAVIGYNALVRVVGNNTSAEVSDYNTSAGKRADVLISDSVDNVSQSELDGTEFISVYSNAVFFINILDKKDGTLVGSIRGIHIVDNRLETANRMFSGTKVDKNIVLDFSAVLGLVEERWSGRLKRDSLILNIPREDGSIYEQTFILGSVDDFNKEAERLQKDIETIKAQDKAQEEWDMLVREEERVRQDILGWNNSLVDDFSRLQEVSFNEQKQLLESEWQNIKENYAQLKQDIEEKQPITQQEFWDIQYEFGTLRMDLNTFKSEIRNLESDANHTNRWITRVKEEKSGFVSKIDGYFTNFPNSLHQINRETPEVVGDLQYIIVDLEKRIAEAHSITQEIYTKAHEKLVRIQHDIENIQLVD